MKGLLFKIFTILKNLVVFSIFIGGLIIGMLLMALLSAVF